MFQAHLSLVYEHELVRYSACLGENYVDLQKALDLMLSVPHRAQDDKFISSIEGYKGSVHKLGRLLAHDRFTITFEDVSKERYLFLFKARILVCKVRRISEERSIFQLKDCIRLTKVSVKDHPEDKYVFELIDKVGGQAIALKLHRDVKEFWLKEIREFAKNHGESEETSSDDLKSPPAEKAEEAKRKAVEKESSKLQETDTDLPKSKKLKEETSSQQESKLSSKTKQAESSTVARRDSKQTQRNVSSIPIRKGSKETLDSEVKKEDFKPSTKSVDETKAVQEKTEVKATTKAEESKNKTKVERKQKDNLGLLIKESEQTNPKKEEERQKIPKPTGNFPNQDKLVEELKLKQSKLERQTKVEQSYQSKSEKASIEVHRKVEQSSVEVTSSCLPVETTTAELLKLETESSFEAPQSYLTTFSDNNKVSAFCLPIETTTADLILESETLKRQIESEEVDDKHLRKIQAVEPLIEINKPRVVEEVIPYIIKPPPEKVPGSAIEKLYSVEKTGESDIKLTDFKVGIEVNVEIGDEMSRRYTSSARSG